MSKIKEYTNGEVTIVWDASLCYHAKNCVNNLPQVFDPAKRPWIDANAASTDQIIETVKKCPSGALTYKLNSNQEITMSTTTNTNINILADGPLIVEGEFEITDSEGKTLEKKSKVALCRCGASENKPFCDGAHKKIDFKAS